VRKTRLIASTDKDGIALSRSADVASNPFDHWLSTNFKERFIRSKATACSTCKHKSSDAAFGQIILVFHWDRIAVKIENI
jgi:hypothetical protein